jgi:hypothetical protein
MNPFSIERKEYISKQIKNISLQEIQKEYNRLIVFRVYTEKFSQMLESHNLPIYDDYSIFSPYSRLGNKIVDHFTFTQRLETKGKYNCNYFDFLQNLETFKQKKFIQNMVTYYKDVKNKNNKKNEFTVYKEIYNICISSINILRPLYCIEIYLKYKAKNVLNFCSGWGGTLVSACALNLNTYTGIDINTNLNHTGIIDYKGCLALTIGEVDTLNKDAQILRQQQASKSENKAVSIQPVIEPLKTGICQTTASCAKTYPLIAQYKFTKSFD